MKTFICALIIVCILTGCVVLNMTALNRMIDKMLDIAYDFPETPDGIRDDFSDIGDDVEKLWKLWDKNIVKISYTISYEDINRADDAINELYTSYITGTKDTFITSRMKAIDALRRIRQMENFNLQSLF